MNDKNKFKNFILFALLVSLSTLIGGVGLYLTFRVYWTAFPLIFVAMIIYGISCLMEANFLSKNTLKRGDHCE